MIYTISDRDRDEHCTDDENSEISMVRSSRSHRGRPKMSRMSIVVLSDELQTSVAAFCYPRLYDFNELLDDIRHKGETQLDTTTTVSDHVFCLKKDISEVERLSKHAKLSFDIVNQVSKSLNHKKQERMRAVAESLKFDIEKMDSRWYDFEVKTKKNEVESKKKWQVWKVIDLRFNMKLALRAIAQKEPLYLYHP